MTGDSGAIRLPRWSKRFGVRVQAYCLLANHAHRVVGTPRGSLSQALGWLQLTYAVRFNHEAQAAYRRAVGRWFGRPAENRWLELRHGLVLGGERDVAVARELGYAGGSGVTQVVKRLEQAATKDRALMATVERLKVSLSRVTPQPVKSQELTPYPDGNSRAAEGISVKSDPATCQESRVDPVPDPVPPYQS